MRKTLIFFNTRRLRAARRLRGAHAGHAARARARDACGCKASAAQAAHARARGREIRHDAARAGSASARKARIHAAARRAALRMRQFLAASASAREKLCRMLVSWSMGRGAPRSADPSWTISRAAERAHEKVRDSREILVAPIPAARRSSQICGVVPRQRAGPGAAGRASGCASRRRSVDRRRAHARCAARERAAPGRRQSALAARGRCFRAGLCAGEAGAARAPLLSVSRAGVSQF